MPPRTGFLAQRNIRTPAPGSSPIRPTGGSAKKGTRRSHPTRRGPKDFRPPPKRPLPKRPLPTRRGPKDFRVPPKSRLPEEPLPTRRRPKDFRVPAKPQFMPGVSGGDTKLPRSAVYQRLTLPIGPTKDFTPYPDAHPPFSPLAAFSSDAPPGVRRDANVIQQYGFSEGPIRPPGIMNPQANLEAWNTPFPRPFITQADYDTSRQNVANLPYLTDEARQTILDTAFLPEISFSGSAGAYYKGPIIMNPYSRFGASPQPGTTYFDNVMLHEQTHVLDSFNNISSNPEFIHWAGEAVDSGLIWDDPFDPSRFAHWYTQLTALPPSLVPEPLRPFMPYTSFEEEEWPFRDMPLSPLEPIQAVMELPLEPGQVGVWFPEGIPFWEEVAMTPEQVAAMKRFERIPGTIPWSGTMSVKDFLILSKMPDNLGPNLGGAPKLVKRKSYAS